MKHYITHIAKEAERWDILAFKYYGNALMMQVLLDENTHLPISDVLEAGSLVYIPILKEQKTQNTLPPWFKESSHD